MIHDASDAVDIGTLLVQKLRKVGFDIRYIVAANSTVNRVQASVVCVLKTGGLREVPVARIMIVTQMDSNTAFGIRGQSPSPEGPSLRGRRRKCGVAFLGRGFFLFTFVLGSIHFARVHAIGSEFV